MDESARIVQTLVGSQRPQFGGFKAEISEFVAVPLWAAGYDYEQIYVVVSRVFDQIMNCIGDSLAGSRCNHFVVAVEDEGTRPIPQPHRKIGGFSVVYRPPRQIFLDPFASVGSYPAGCLSGKPDRQYRAEGK